MKRILSWIPAALLLLVSQQVFAFGESKSWSAGWENEKVFIENRGQFPVTGAKDPGVLFAWDNGKELIYFRRDGFFYDLMDKTRKEESGEEEKFRNEKEFLEHEKEEHRVNFRHDRIGITWTNADPAVQVAAEGMAEGYFNHQVKENGQSYSIDGARGYTKLSYKNLYPQIDLVFEFHPQDGIKYTIIVHPGGNPAQVQLLYSGMKRLNLSLGGDLKIGTGATASSLCAGTYTCTISDASEMQLRLPPAMNFLRGRSA